MKKIIITFFTFLWSIATMAQTTEKSLQISAPAGYRVYINGEFKGLTSEDQDGLFINLNLSNLFLEVKKQNNIIYSDSIFIEKEITEINLYDKIIEEKPKTEYDYWQELIDMLGNKNMSANSKMDRDMALMVAEMDSKAKPILNQLRSKNLSETIRFDAIPNYSGKISNFFYYGQLGDIKTMTGMKNTFFIIFFHELNGKYTAFLRYQVSKSMQDVVSNLSREKGFKDIQNQKTYSNYIHFIVQNDNNFNFNYYPKLGVIKLDYKITTDDRISIDLWESTDYMSFTWLKSNTSNILSAINSKDISFSTEPIRGTLFKKYW